jgi:hypothetical protein
MQSGRIIGIFATIIGLGLAVIGGLWLASQTASGSLETGGMLLGAFLIFVIAAPIIAFGAYMFMQGQKDSERETEMSLQRKLLDMVKTQGQVNIAEAAIELNVDVSRLKELLYSLVGLQVYTGYINWDKGILYSAEASALRDLKACENCGGEIALEGKGIMACQYCGTEYFLAN